MVWKRIDWVLARDQYLDAYVWVSMNSVDVAWRLEASSYIDYGGHGNSIEGRYERVGRWLQVHTDLWVPAMCLDENGVLSITDGRHRLAWLRDHKATALLVAVPPMQRRVIDVALGSDERITRWCQ